MEENNEIKMTFEQALAKLEDLVRRMENGNLTLEEMITGYEDGSRLAAFCRSRLNGLEEKIKVLTDRDRVAEGESAWSEMPVPEAAAPQGDGN
ncbi:MAG: exodeoxyribonuclease VII small subunit [Victivallaceae bacterium]|nr:exodeoxyribonuclease VII small subunit [Victivallaceae bacterium]